MAESVDALVSNTNGCKAVPVRPRLWVLKASDFSEAFLFLPYGIRLFYILENLTDFILEAARNYHSGSINI